MINGAGDIDGGRVSGILRRASAEIEGDPLCRDVISVVGKVVAQVSTEYDAWLMRLRADAAAFFSQLDQLSAINSERVGAGLQPLTGVLPEHIGVSGDPANAADIVRVV
jgi:hypothetical protein